jgi:hypothetical protein
VGNDGKGKKKGKGRGTKPRKGAGNRPKNLQPDRTEKATVDRCNLCGKNLTGQDLLESSNERIVEDIPDIVERPEVIKIEQEKKYCHDCREVITAKSELALPKADMGLNSTILICYLWVALCLPFSRIRDYLKAFFGKDLSTSGLSRHDIRVSKIMTASYDEILGDINNAVTLHADETGWRVRGKNWWLWVFGNQDSAYFSVDQSQGGSVVLRVLGEKVFKKRLKRLKKRLEILLNWPNPDDNLQEIIKKVKRQQPRILTFVEHPDAPCHNNYGKFLIRIGVLKRKVSGGSVSAEGANAYAILLSIYVTCRLGGISFPKYMKESLRHYIRTVKPMLLRKYSTFITESRELQMAA